MKSRTPAGCIPFSQATLQYGFNAKNLRKLIHEGTLKFQTEFLLGYYRIDEADPKLKLAVEVDGCYWHGCVDCGFPGLRSNHSLDKRKNSYLESQGWRVLRLKEHEINLDVESCVERGGNGISKQKEALNGP